MPTEREEPELEPCPFCGERRGATYKGYKWWRVECATCHAEGPEADTEPEAVAAWNRRAGGSDV